MPKARYVCIVWEDSCEVQGWVDLSEIAEVAEITSIGILVGDTKSGVTIATSTHENTAISPLTIPRNCILKIQEIEVEWSGDKSKKEPREEPC